MAGKRSRAAFEADLQAQQSPYVFYGTPLPPLDPNVRDDGSYVPIWKQEVTDDRGRKRLHGAFTGGFSAGYFNTVGSKEGWAPSSFVSSRSNRWKDAGGVQQKAEDFMDEEDLAEAEEARKVSTKDTFSGLGSTEDEVSRRAPLVDLLRPSGENMGVKLLQKMGWRDGQGIGPKLWRKARLEGHEAKENGEEKHLFAPHNSRMITFVRKNDHKGLGFAGEEKLNQPTQTKSKSSDSEDDGYPARLKPKKKAAPKRGAFGIGVLNDTGSDDEDPYSMGPRISYNRVMGVDKKKKKRPATKSLSGTTNGSNPLLNDRHLFVPKKLNKSSGGFRRCHDGLLPLDGFILSTHPSIPQETKYQPPKVPPDWISSKRPLTTTSTAQNPSTHQSKSDLAKSSTHTPCTRGSLLGETSLPGKSVFSFLKPEAREKIASLTHNPSLPAAGSEIPSSPSQKDADPTSLIPLLDPEIAARALGRGVKGFIPYADDPAKLERYRAFLSFRAGLNPQNQPAGDAAPAPTKPKDFSKDEWVAELHEFAHAATIFKPMTGIMASRFTSASTSTSTGDKEHSGEARAAATAAKKPSDPAEDAAALNMFGPLTRSAAYFYPSRLLCKRFDVPVPAHVNSANEGTSG
ncbi:MAG: hypothetical protein LQ340_006133, partial [Diploschistes diacapsis]